MLMTEEEREEGVVNVGVFWYFFSAGPVVLIFLLVVLQLGGQVANQAGSFWLQDWGDAVIHSYMTTGKPLSNEVTIKYFNKYAWLMMIPVGAASLASALGIIHMVYASRKLHTLLLNRILGAPISFFDTTPEGRIMNRFSNDLRNLDVGIGFFVILTFNSLSLILATIGAIAYTTKGTFLIVLVPVGYFFYLVQNTYRKANIDLQRLGNIAKSPILVDFSQVTERLSLYKVNMLSILTVSNCALKFI